MYIGRPFYEQTMEPAFIALPFVLGSPLCTCGAQVLCQGQQQLCLGIRKHDIVTGALGISSGRDAQVLVRTMRERRFGVRV